MFTRIFLSCALSVFLSVAGMGCEKKVSLERGEKEKGDEKKTLRHLVEEMQGGQSVVDVPVIRIVPRTIVDEISLPGELTPDRTALVRPQTDGRILFLRQLKVGDAVAEGEVLAKIDDRDLVDRIERQEKQIEISKETIGLDEAAYEQGREDLAFDKQLLADGFLNQQEYRRSELALKRTEVSLRQNRLRLEQEKNELQKISRDREKVPIAAPISGIVVLPRHLLNQAGGTDLLDDDIMALDGKMVGTSTDLIGVVSRDGFRARCLVGAKDRGRIQLGQAARVVVAAHNTVTVAGTVSKISLLQDPRSHAYSVWIDLEKQDATFSTGNFARAFIELGRAEKAIVVDRGFVKEAGNRQFVQVVDDDRVKDVDVALAIRQGVSVQILSSLTSGSLVVASQRNLTAGQTVRPVEIDPGRN